MSLLHSIPFRHAIHFLACITLDLISLWYVPLVSNFVLRGWSSCSRRTDLAGSNIGAANVALWMLFRWLHLIPRIFELQPI